MKGRSFLQHSRAVSVKDRRQFLLGAGVVGHLIPEQYPMIMIDQVIEYCRLPHPQLTAERYISANDPVFVGHFPGLKLWPGIHTIEGLRQCCSILNTLCQLQNANLLDELLELQKRQMLEPLVSEAMCQRILDALENMHLPKQLPLILRIKLLAPVFAGCVIKYQVYQNHPDLHSWSVQAEVNGQSVAKGDIVCQPLGG